MDLIFPHPETVSEIRFRNWYTARYAHHITLMGKRIELVLRILGEFKAVHKCTSGFSQDQRVINAKVML